MPWISENRRKMRQLHRLAYANFKLERERLMLELVSGKNPVQEVVVAMGTICAFDRHGEPIEEYSPMGNCKRYLAPLYGLMDEASDMFGPGVYGDPIKVVRGEKRPIYDW